MKKKYYKVYFDIESIEGGVHKRGFDFEIVDAEEDETPTQILKRLRDSNMSQDKKSFIVHINDIKPIT